MLVFMFVVFISLYILLTICAILVFVILNTLKSWSDEMLLEMMEKCIFTTHWEKILYVTTLNKNGIFV